MTAAKDKEPPKVLMEWDDLSPNGKPRGRVRMILHDVSEVSIEAADKDLMGGTRWVEIPSDAGVVRSIGWAVARGYLIVSPGNVEVPTRNEVGVPVERHCGRWTYDKDK